MFFNWRPQKLMISSPLICRLLHNVKLTVKISSIFVAFLENMNFIVKNGNSSSLNTSQLSTWADNCHKSYRLRTLISFSNESSFPLRAFLSMTFMACRSPGRSLLSANLTCEKAPLNTSWKYSYRYIFFCTQILWH